MKWFSFTCVVLFSQFLRAQINFSIDTSIPVNQFGNQLKQPWSGGFNNAQFSNIDFDFDGDDDLLVFDRSGDQIRLFENRLENGNRKYVYIPYGFQFFPSDLRYRVQTADFNRDGKMDLFTYGVGGMKVYKNNGTLTTGLLWEEEKALLYSDYNGLYLNLYVSSSDIPAIVDVDFDEDLDILTYNIGGEFVQYHKNLSRELYGHSDSLVFQLKNECWGLFREDLNSNQLYLNVQEAPCGTGNVPDPQKVHNVSTKAHSGSTLLVLDYDGSGVLDLLIGDVATPNMNLLINGGTVPNSNSAMVSQNPSFPSNSTPVNMTLFPAAFLLDTDFDGKKDLIISPNAKNVSENESSVLMYKNTSLTTSYNFVYSTNSFLQNEMMDHGTAVAPHFVDLNMDGLLDLVVSNYYSYQTGGNKISRIALYLNIGTASVPSFTLLDRDFLSLSTTNFGLKMTPTFGDLNGDNKPEMILGLENGTLVYFVNTTTSSSNITYANPVLELKDADNQLISSGQFAAPQLFDFNSDGKLDLIVGAKSGELMYYENVGSTSIPSFKFRTATLGNIDVAPASPDGFAQPHFFKKNNQTFLFLGAYDGKIRYYGPISSDFTLGFDLIQENLSGIGKEVKQYSTPTTADLDNDGKLNLFVGQDLGGILAFEEDENSTLSFENQQMDLVKIYPNPFQNELEILINYATTYEIVSLQGSSVKNGQLLQGENKLDLNELANGIYLARIGSRSYLIQKQ
ncbi:MAG: hypothetical protein RL264_2572 [Bacteroidota bacterium]|jgi:hypothetical protein